MSIEKPYVTTREQVKAYLGITDASHDTQIDVYLPVVSDDIEVITNNNFIYNKTGGLTNGSADISSINTTALSPGNVVSSSDFSQATIVSIGDDTATIDTEAGVTVQDTGVQFNVFPVAKKPIVAQMVLFNIRKYSIHMDMNGILKSESAGSYSWTRDTIGTIAGYPMEIIKALAEITRPRFH